MKKVLSVFAFLLLFSVSAQDVNLLKNGDFSRYKVNWVTNGQVKEEGKSGVLILSAKNNLAYSRQVMEIDGNKDTLQITADISADKPVQIYLGLIPADKNWKEFYFRNTGCVAGTFTVLASPLVRNTNKVVLKGIVPFKKSAYIAFNAKADNSDLPNFQLERIKSVSTENGNTIVTLANRIRRSYPAGTSVRCHVDGPTYLYSSVLRKGFPGKVKASGAVGKAAKVKFRPGTAGVKVCILLVPFKNAKDVKAEIRNVRVVKINK
jgi:hypothetical protein